LLFHYLIVILKIKHRFKLIKAFSIILNVKNYFKSIDLININEILVKILLVGMQVSLMSKNNI